MSLTDPILAAIKAAVPKAKVHDAVVPRNIDGTPLDLTYVVLYPDLGVLSAPALCGTLNEKDIIYRVVYVSTTRAAVENLCEAVRPVFIGQRYTDSGWTAEFDVDEFHNTVPVSWDEDIPSRVVFSAADQFRASAHK